MTLHRRPARECLPTGRRVKGLRPFGIKPGATRAGPLQEQEPGGRPPPTTRPIYSARRNTPVTPRTGGQALPRKTAVKLKAVNPTTPHPTSYPPGDLFAAIPRGLAQFGRGALALFRRGLTTRIGSRVWSWLWPCSISG